MARKFSHPNVAALEVGGSTEVHVPYSVVARRVTLYGARNGKRYQVASRVDVDGQQFAQITRLPDPEPQA